MIRSPQELEALRNVLDDPKVANLMGALASVVPAVPDSGKQNAGMIEI